MTIVVGAIVSLLFSAAVVWGHWVTRPRARRTAAHKTRVVIVGGGFAGVFTASELEKRLGERGDIEGVLIRRGNYFCFQPQPPRVLSGRIGSTPTGRPVRPPG